MRLRLTLEVEVLAGQSINDLFQLWHDQLVKVTGFLLQYSCCAKMSTFPRTCLGVGDAAPLCAPDLDDLQTGVCRAHQHLRACERRGKNLSLVAAERFDRAEGKNRKAQALFLIRQRVQNAGRGTLREGMARGSY